MQASSDNNQSLGGELKGDAKSVAGAAINRLHREVDQRKSGGASQINEVSSALKKTADGLNDGSPEWLKSALEKSADQISGFATSLEQKDSRQLAEEVSSFARQSPVTFIAACAAAGFAAARIFKAGTEGGASTQESGTNHGEASPYEVGVNASSATPIQGVRL